MVRRRVGVWIAAVLVAVRLTALAVAVAEPAKFLAGSVPPRVATAANELRKKQCN